MFFKKISKPYILFAIGCGLLFIGICVWSLIRDLLFLSNRVQENITFEDGAWSTSAYNADPLLPASSSIYVLASDGFVLERWKPITGFLDASDFKHLLAFSEIQTIQTSSQQDWRIYSLPFEKDGHVHGVITLSSYHPVPEVLPSFDTEMKSAAQFIAEHVSWEESRLIVSNFDQRKLPHYLSFQVVNEFNKIILKSNNTNSIDRLPNFIDPSYVASQLEAIPVQVLYDARKSDFFLTYTQPLKDDDGAGKGVIVVGRSLGFLLHAFVLYVLCVVAGAGIFEAFIFLMRESSRQRTPPLSITFDEKNAQIVIGSDRLPIAYASNQYYLCVAVFSRRQKRWELDELLEKFGEEPKKDSWRKIYDAMNHINKKAFPYVGKKLILLEEKTYRLNPDFV